MVFPFTEPSGSAEVYQKRPNMSKPQRKDVSPSRRDEPIADVDQQISAPEEIQMLAKFQAATPEVKQMLADFWDASPEVKEKIKSLLDHSSPAEPEEGKVHSDRPEKPHKRKRLSDDLDLGQSKKARPIETQASMFDCYRIRNPRERLESIVQVNDGPLIGLPLEPSCSPMLWLDAGLRGDPSLGLVFYLPGGKTGEICNQRWSLDDHVEGKWVIQQLSIGRMEDEAPGHPSRNLEVREQCPEDRHELLYFVELTVNGHKKGFLNSKRLQNSNMLQAEANSLRVLSKTGVGCRVRVWFFIEPKENYLREQCLQVLMELFQQRTRPLSLVENRNGRSYMEETYPSNRIPEADRETDSSKSEANPSPKSSKKPKAQPHTDERIFASGVTPGFPFQSPQGQRSGGDNEAHDTSTTAIDTPALKATNAKAPSNTATGPSVSDMAGAASVHDQTANTADTAFQPPLGSVPRPTGPPPPLPSWIAKDLPPSFEDLLESGEFDLLWQSDDDDDEDDGVDLEPKG